MEIPTIRIKDPDVPGGIIINVADFDPSKHEAFDGQAPGNDPPRKPTKEERAAALEALSATEVREIIDDLELEATNKAENIERILAAEYPEPPAS